MTLLSVLAAWCIGSLLFGVRLGRFLGEDSFGRSAPGEPDVPPSGPGRCPTAASVPLRDVAGDVHRMLGVLERHEPRLAKTVLLCWIGGLSPRRAAETLGVPATLAAHDLQVARQLLRYGEASRA